MKEKIINFQEYKNKKNGITEEEEIEIIDNENEVEGTISENLMECMDNEEEIEGMGYDELYDTYCEIIHINKKISDEVVERCKKDYMHQDDKTLKQMLWEANIENVLDILADMFDYEVYEIEAYREMCKDLLVKEVDEAKGMQLVINDEGEFIAIKEDKLVRDLELKSWEEWLASKCSRKIMDKMTEEEWIARCLWSMTFVSFEEDGILERNEIIQALKKGIEESKEKDRYTVKELMWKVKWEDVLEVIRDFYIYSMDLDEIEELEKEYECFYRYLLSKQETKKDENTRIICKMTGEVYMYDIDSEDVKEICEEYWGIVLATKCSEVSYETVSFEEMVAHIVAEMMFFTSNEDEHIEIMKKREENLKQ